jgi:predicted SpoU family rRNA methylase
LIFVCPPDERDRRITISQIHTHKIRGADIVLISEYDDDLKKAVEGVPSNVENYWSKFIELPKTGDKNIFVFEAAVVLQFLAFKMSVAKMKYLNRSQVENHGVHPDVPKNVSKSITVD